MSAAQIIQELPKLPLPERREILSRLLELDEEQAGVLACSQAAMEAGAMLDAMEAENGPSSAQ